MLNLSHAHSELDTVKAVVEAVGRRGTPRRGRSGRGLDILKWWG